MRSVRTPYTSAAYVSADEGIALAWPITPFRGHVRPYRAVSGVHKIMPYNPVTLCRDLRILPVTLPVSRVNGVFFLLLFATNI